MWRWTSSLEKGDYSSETNLSYMNSARVEWNLLWIYDSTFFKQLTLVVFTSNNSQKQLATPTSRLRSVNLHCEEASHSPRRRHPKLPFPLRLVMDAFIEQLYGRNEEASAFSHLTRTQRKNRLKLNQFMSCKVQSLLGMKAVWTDFASLAEIF